MELKYERAADGEDLDIPALIPADMRMIVERHNQHRTTRGRPSQNKRARRIDVRRIVEGAAAAADVDAEIADLEKLLAAAKRRRVELQQQKK